MAVQANAAWYDLTYTDGGANAGTGSIDVVGGVAVSGSFTVTAGTATGTWTLSPGAGVAGGFQWDNVVNPTSDPFLTSGGLLFTSGGNELNLWGTGPGQYDLWGNLGGGYNPVSSGGIATLTAVPEPTTMVAGAMLLLPFGVSTLRMLRKSRTA